METDTDARIRLLFFSNWKSTVFLSCPFPYPSVNVSFLSHHLPIQCDKIYIFCSLSLQKIPDTIITCKHNRFPRILLVHIYVNTNTSCTSLYLYMTKIHEKKKKKWSANECCWGFFFSNFLLHFPRVNRSLSSWQIRLHVASVIAFYDNGATCDLTRRRGHSVRGPVFAARWWTISYPSKHFFFFFILYILAARYVSLNTSHGYAGHVIGLLFAVRSVQ